MPVEIRELVIRATVASDTAPTSSKKSTPDYDQQAIVEACVKQVMRILRKSRER